MWSYLTHNFSNFLQHFSQVFIVTYCYSGSGLTLYFFPPCLGICTPVIGSLSSGLSRFPAIVFTSADTVRICPILQHVCPAFVCLFSPFVNLTAMSRSWFKFPTNHPAKVSTCYNHKYLMPRHYYQSLFHLFSFACIDRRM